MIVFGSQPILLIFLILLKPSLKIPSIPLFRHSFPVLENPLTKH